MKITTGDLLTGVLTANVVNAINASIDKIDANHIDVESIKSEIISAIEITAESISSVVIEAINISTTNAQIKNAKIESLDVSKLVGKEISTEILKSNIITAINASIGTITSDHIDVESLKAEIIDAIEINADTIKGFVIEAINLSTETAQIKNAKIESLDVSKLTGKEINVDILKSNVINAVNAAVGTITSDHIDVESIDCGRLTVGDIKSSLIETSVIDAINANVNKAYINEGMFKQISADKIIGGTLDMGKVSINSLNGSISMQDNTITIKDNQDPAKVRVQLGLYNPDTTTDSYGLIILNKDSIPIFDSDRGIISDKGLSDNVVTTDKIKDEAVSPSKINFDLLFASEAFITKMHTISLDAGQITTGQISGERINIEGLVSFNSLDPDLQDKFTYDGSNTYIDGNKIYAGSVKADSLDVRGLLVSNSALDKTLEITTDGDIFINGTLQSSNYSYIDKTGYSITTDGKAVFYDAKLMGELILEDAGISNSESGIRFWAGSTYENNHNANFIVKSDGEVICKKLNATGIWNNGEVNISNLHLSDTENSNATIVFKDNDDLIELIKFSGEDTSFITNDIYFGKSTDKAMEILTNDKKININSEINIGNKAYINHEYDNIDYLLYSDNLKITNYNDETTLFSKDIQINAKTTINEDLIVEEKIIGANSNVVIKYKENSIGFYISDKTKDSVVGNSYVDESYVG